MAMLISLFRVTFWFDTVYNIVTRWVNFSDHEPNDSERVNVQTRLICHTFDIYNVINQG